MHWTGCLLRVIEIALIGFLVTRLGLPETTGEAGSGGTTTSSVSVVGYVTGSASWVSGSEIVSVPGREPGRSLLVFLCLQALSFSFFA